MLIKPDQRTLEALARLSVDTDFIVFKSWLEDVKRSLHAESPQIRDEVLLRWNQGEAQAVNDVLDRIESAQAALRKSR
ncbi:hypothetical protein UFOVP1304_41 [uncultured Caudovirales phage]|uniref:Uncharacterized protein n=1 Tax=uncultured Caudovirales phage TaxID=2100421 RepID=A0A6J5RS97_9CAUD|nr:hypothetical protein UFOVP1304_41 [uncultured Caudovirales phage]